MKKEITQPHFKDITLAQAREALKNDMTTILSNAERIATEKDINRKELAFRMDSHESHISRMFRNKYYGNGLTIKVLGRLALALEVKTYELLK